MFDSSLHNSRSDPWWPALDLKSNAWSVTQGAVVAAGLLSAVLFIIVGLAWDLQLYADGSIFAYAVALQDSWAIHWHNISGRVTVYLLACLPAELFVGLTGNARGGITLYALLFFSAQLIGLACTYATDRSPRRLVFTTACLSTACLCPLVFGFPTEMWYAHALFWPTLALAHYAPLTAGGFLVTLAAFAALAHTHGGGVVFAAAAVLTTALRVPSGALVRALAAFSITMAAWGIMQATFRPDDQISPVLVQAALNFIDPRNLMKAVMGLLIFATLGQAVLFLAFARLGFSRPGLLAASGMALALGFYWIVLDQNLLVEDRYFLRTALFYVVPPLGVAALLVTLQQEGRLIDPIAGWVPRAAQLLSRRGLAQAAMGGLCLVSLVHTVETAKFVDGWTDYARFVRNLSKGAAVAAAAGDTRFVSSNSIPVDLREFSWSSTTHYLSVVATPDLDPARLVINPDEGYHWITCQLAKRHAGRRAVPEKTRKLVEVHACAAR